MKLSPLEEYGLRCLIQLARRGNAQPVTIRQISEGEGLSAAYVGKLMFLLQKANLVQSTRGVQGGYVLAKPARETSLFEIFQALDPGVLDDVCEKFTGTEDACVHNGACAIKPVWKGLAEHINAYLERVNLDDLAHVPALQEV
jgi:Rrf2 family transcriptional regulator, iron-sulfur cluster assembly transcription factor